MENKAISESLNILAKNGRSLTTYMKTQWEELDTSFNHPSCLGQMNMLLGIVDSVNLQLVEQASQLQTMRRELDGIEANLFSSFSRPVRKPLHRKAKMIRKMRRRRNVMAKILGSVTDLTDDETEVEIQLEGLGKFCSTNGKYKQVLSKN